jgi:hypothetical protein
MTDDANLLELLDTTVTLEWESTRSIGTLVSLGGRVAQLTALRAPEVGTQVYLRIENDDPAQAMALDGRCASVVDSDWGEQQVEVSLQRVGTTASAAVLREFIEKHGIDLGGSVSVGRNRDNPDLKRFVYSLPDAAPAAAERPTARQADPPQGVSAPAAVAAPQFGRSGAERAAVPQAASAPQSSAAPASSAPAMGTGDPDLSSALLEAMNSLGSQAPRPATAPHTADADATRVMATVASQAAAPEPMRQRPAAAPIATPTTRDTEHDVNEQILVHIVDPRSPVAAPVVDVNRRTASSSVMQRILGGIGKGSASTPGIPSAPGAASVAAPARMASSDKIMSAAELYAGDQAQRVDMKVQFEAGPKKRKYDGNLLRLSESKLRVSTQVLPATYERVVVYLAGKGGPKDVLALHCEVTRVHTNDTSGEGSFDARLTAGGNPGPVMAKLRQMLQEMAGGAAP